MTALFHISLPGTDAHMHTAAKGQPASQPCRGTYTTHVHTGRDVHFEVSCSVGRERAPRILAAADQMAYDCGTERIHFSPTVLFQTRLHRFTAPRLQVRGLGGHRVWGCGVLGFWVLNFGVLGLWGLRPLGLSCRDFGCAARGPATGFKYRQMVGLSCRDKVVLGFRV